MDHLKELREQRGKAIQAGRDLLERAKAEKRDLSAEEQQSYDEAFADQESMRDRIEREEKQVELDREAASLVAADERKAEPKDDKGIEMRAFNKAIVYGPNALEGDETRALQMTNDAAGGYLIPPVEWINQFIQAVDNMTFMRGLSTVHRSSAKSIGAPALATDIEDASWSSEIGTVNEDTELDFGARELSTNQLSKLIKVSMKLLNHASSAESIVMQRLAYKNAVAQEKAFLSGSGASQPLGVFTANANGISTGRDVSSGNTNTAIKADNLREIKYTLKGQYHGSAQWIFHRDAVKMISKLKDGDGQYIWSPGIRDEDHDTLMGFPVNMSEYAPNTFTSGLYVGILGDFSNYWVLDSEDMQVQRLMELYAATSQVGFISRSYTDGMPVLEEAFARVTLT